MSVRKVGGLLLVAFGSAVAARSVDSPASVISAVNAHLGQILVGLGILAFVISIAPRGTLVLPSILVALGAALQVVRNDPEPTARVGHLLGLAALAVGGSLIMSLEDSELDQSVDPVHRHTAILRPLTIAINGQAPPLVEIRAVATTVKVDYSGAKGAAFNSTELAITCLAGRIEVVLPPTWPAIGGRLASAHNIRLEGKLDSTRLAPTPQVDDQARWIADVSKKRAVKVDGPGAKESFAVVIHILGLGGEVVLVGR